MNKIIIDNNKLLDYENKNIIIKNNNITFINNGSYNIEIINTRNINLEFKINSNINITLFIYSVNNKMKANVRYMLGENSSLLVYKFCSNISNNVIEEVYLEGKYSSIDYRLSSISGDLCEYKMKIYHNNLNVRSNISNKCVGLDNSKVTFIIDSILEKGNTNCYMNQDTKVMCLGDVDATIEPNMLIDEDDVEARHGSVVGRFDLDNLFYLMSRGISEDVAMRLMIKGFILSHLSISKDYEDTIIKVLQNKIE